MAKNEVIVHDITSWQQYLGLIHNLAVQFGDGNSAFSISPGAIFRGQTAPNWKLTSKLERNLQYEVRDGTNKIVFLDLKKTNGADWYQELSSSILERFKQNVHQLPYATKFEDDMEAWALGRHHGLLTPYLDWSTNPYVATFFAFDSQYRRFELVGTKSPDVGKFVTVWRLNLWDKIFTKQEFEIVQLIEKIGTRLHAQEGVFTILKTANYSDVESYLKSKGLAHHLERYNLPTEIALEALNALDTMGINIFRLFPDYIGAAEDANISKHTLRSTHQLSKIIKQRQLKNITDLILPSDKGGDTP